MRDYGAFMVFAHILGYAGFPRAARHYFKP